jgi:hypothetical protein
VLLGLYKKLLGGVKPPAEKGVSVTELRKTA